MGRLSEILWFINAEKAPSQDEMAFHYHYISKTPELMKLRKYYRKTLKSEKKDEMSEKMALFDQNDVPW